MDESITLALPMETRDAIESADRRDGISPVQPIENAIRDALLIREFRSLRAVLPPEARALGIETDQEVFDLISSPVSCL